MKSLQMALLAAVVSALSSCGQRIVVGSGAVKTEQRTLRTNDFTSVEISAPVDASITVGGAPSLSFKGYGNVLKELRAEVKDHTLRIYIREDVDISTDNNITASITLPALNALDISGSTTAIVTGAVRTTDFNMDLSGSGNVLIDDIQAQSFKADISGAGSLELKSGTVGSGAYDISGSGAIKAFNVSQKVVSVDVSGSGTASVNASDKLNVDISGSATIRYKGHPAITQDIAGSGSIQDAN